MNYLIFVCLFLSIPTKEIEAQIFGGAKPPDADPLYVVETFWFKQILDHNSNGTPAYWYQRYFVNQAAWTKQANSPVFLMVGGESTISESWMTGGAWVQWAYRYGALLFQLEHRFYGQSHPTQDVTVDSLQYLTSEQAINDIQNFIEQMYTQYNLNSTTNKCILFGGSYPGNLVAWARLKKPDNVYGSISSSGPYQATADFYQYDDVVRESLDYFSPGCSSQLTKAIKSIQSQFRTYEGIRNIIKKFNICYGFNANDPRDFKIFIQSIFGPIARAVQYNNEGSPNENVYFVCNYLNNRQVPDPVDRLAQLTNVTKGGKCTYANYRGTIAFYQSSLWNSTAVINNTRQWLYQTCNEFGYYQTSEAWYSLLSNTLDMNFFYQQCTDIFGSNFNSSQLDEAVSNTNQNYGGTAIQVDRVVFVQGSIDPWHALGMVQNPTEESPLIYIRGTSHCQDMNTPRWDDLPSLRNARIKIGSYLDKWLLPSNSSTSA